MLKTEEIRELLSEYQPELQGEVLNYLTDKYTKLETIEEATEQVKALTPTTIALSYADARVNQAQKKWKREQKTREGTTDTSTSTKGEEEPRTTPPATSTPPTSNSTTTSTDTTALLGAIRTLQAELDAMKLERHTEVRQRELNKLTDTLPEALQAPFKRIEIATMTDEAFSDLMEELRTDVANMQGALPKGIVTAPRSNGLPHSVTPTPQKVTSAELDELIKLTDN